MNPLIARLGFCARRPVYFGCFKHAFTTTAVLKQNIQISLPPELVSAIEDRFAKSKECLEKLKSQSQTAVSSVTVQAALGGMRGVHALVCETSTVDPQKGLAYRGHPIQELMPKLPSLVKASNPDLAYPSSEALLWLLLTGKIPTTKETEIIRQVLLSHMKLPEHVVFTLRALPASTHPMTQFLVGIAACQTESVFAPLYAGGELLKADHWKHALQDGLTLIARLPAIAGWIYRRTTLRPEIPFICPPPDLNQDWAGNLARMIGIDTPNFDAVMRLYMYLHADHEGGNVSAHTGHIVASALADPYTAFCASMAGLAGPLHGLANQQALGFLQKVQSDLQAKNLPPTEESVNDYLDTMLAQKGQVIPGFGHAVLRVTDPRYTIQQQFCEHTMQNSPLYQLLKLIVQVTPKKLEATGKVKSPYPNVDAISGTILHHYGLKELRYYTTLFGVSRSLGMMSQIVWARLLNLPIERPKSMTLEMLYNMSKQS